MFMRAKWDFDLKAYCFTNPKNDPEPMEVEIERLANEGWELSEWHPFVIDDNNFIALNMVRLK